MLQIRNKYVQRGNYIYNTREKEEKKTEKNIFDNKKRKENITKKRLHDILLTRTNIKLVLTITINVLFSFLFFFFWKDQFTY